MKEKITYGLWGFLYILCAGLGFLGSQEGFVGGLLTTISLLFFVPGVLLLYWGKRKMVRLISALSLGLTLILLLVNFASLGMSETAGNLLYGILIVVSSPMVCSGYWVLSLFLWACLLMGSFLKRK